MSSLSKLLENFPYRLILGSASPRRQELLKSLGFTFTCKPINADETFPLNLKAEEIPIFLSKKKADAYPEKLEKEDLLITSDTVVWCKGEVFNKPENFEEGKKMLSALSGNMHEVFTAVTFKSSKKQITFHDTTKVYFKKLSDEEIEYYLLNFKPYDKAGGYGVQDWIGYIAIDRIEGSFYNVMGLPVQKLYENLIRF